MHFVYNMFNVKPHSINIIEFTDKGEFNINLFETRRYKTTLNNIILCDIPFQGIRFRNFVVYSAIFIRYHDDQLSGQ